MKDRVLYIKPKFEEIKILYVGGGHGEYEAWRTHEGKIGNVTISVQTITPRPDGMYGEWGEGKTWFYIDKEKKAYKTVNALKKELLKRELIRS